MLGISDGTLTSVARDMTVMESASAALQILLLRKLVDPRLAHQERLQAEKATAGDGTPAALAAAIEKRRLAAEAQMRALDEGLEPEIMSPRRAREEALEADRKKKFAERQAKRQHRRRSQDQAAHQ